MQPDKLSSPSVTDTTASKINTNKVIDGDINQINVSVDVQDIIDGKQKIVVWVQNSSKYIFSGTLSIKIKSNIDNSQLGSDSIFIEKLISGQKTYGIIWSKPSSSLSSEYNWFSKSFEEDLTQIPSNISPYKLLKEKKEEGGTLVPQIEF